MKFLWKATALLTQKKPLIYSTINRPPIGRFIYPHVSCFILCKLEQPMGRDPNFTSIEVIEEAITWSESRSQTIQELPSQITCSDAQASGPQTFFRLLYQRV